MTTSLTEKETDPVPTSSAAYLTIARFHGNGEQLLDEYRKYSDAMSGVGQAHGLILHAGAQTDSGFLVVNLWPSKECSEAAAGDPRRLDVLERAEINSDQIRREHHRVAHFVVFGEDGAPCSASDVDS